MPDESSRAGGRGARTLLALAGAVVISLALGAYLWSTRESETPRGAPPGTAEPRMPLREAEECFTRPERVLAASGRWVNALAVSPDGRRVLSGGSDGTLLLWDLESGLEFGQLEGHTSEIRSLVFSPDGENALSGDRDGTIRLWDLAAGRERSRFDGRIGTIYALAFSPDGSRALAGGGRPAIGGGRGQRLLWGGERGQTLQRLAGHVFAVSALAFSPDGKRALSGGVEGEIRLWDLERGETVRTLSGHERYVSSITFFPDGNRAVSGSGDNTVRVWDLASGRETMKLTAGTGGVNSMALSPDARRALAGGYELVGDEHHNVMRLWDLQSGRLIRSFRFPQRDDERHSGVLHVVISPDGRRALSGGGWGEVQGHYYDNLRHAELLLWRLPDERGYRLLGTEEE